MVINPYADQIDFPAGTSPSLINTILQINAANRARQAQPNWWETGINNVLNGVTGQVVMPWLQNQFVNEPFQSFKTDELIRQKQAEFDAAYNKDIAEKKWAEEQAQRQNSQLGNAFNYYGQIANTPRPFETSTGGGVNPYGPYEDPWSTGTIPTPDMMERTPPSQTVTDEMGTREVQREPEGITQPIDSGKANIFSTGSRPSSAEALQMFAAKYPTEAGVLGKFLTANNVFNMIDPNKQEKARADIEAQKALSETRNAQANERKTLLDDREALLRSQADRNQAAATRAGAETNRIEALAQSEIGRQTIVQYILDHPELSDEDVQRMLAVVQRAQLRETPEQIKQRSFGTTALGANKPSIPGLVDERATLRAKIDMGKGTPADIARLKALDEEDKLNATPPKENWQDILLKPFIERMQQNRVNPAVPSLSGGRTPISPPPSTATSPYDRLKR